jgi:ligand-binding sensor domain-containing protein
VRPIVRDTHGDLWVGTMSGLSRLRDGNWSSYSTKDGLAGNIIHALLAHSDGSLWVASSHGIDRRVEGRWERLVDSSRDIGSLAESAGGGVYYVSENKAVYEYLDGRSSRIDVGDQVIGRSRLLIDARSQLWLTGERGLARRGSDGSWTRWTTQHGLASNSVYFLTEDHSGNIWFGYHSARGVTRFDGREFRSWTTADGLHNDSVYSLGVDAENNIWLGTARGVDRFDGRFFTNFGTDEGYAHHESNAGGFLANPDGTLYFGTAGGVSHYDPRYAQDLRRAPKVRIEEIRLGGRNFNPNKPIHADADEDDLFVRVSTDSFAPAARQELRYRLLGYDEDWGDMTGDVIAFASLPNSSYVLELQARKYAGPWSAASHVSFQVHRPFYRTLWFASLFVVAILGLACVLLSSKLRRNNAPQTPELRAQKCDDELEASEALIELREALARPLQFLQSHSANILAENPNPKTQRSALDVRDVATHIQQLVDGAIELEHGHHSTPPVAKEFKLRRLLKSVFYTAADTARRRGIDTQYTIDGSVPDLARGNGEQLQILLSLLLHEAVKASDGEHISIAANYDVRDEQLRIDILAGASTEGVGIRAAKLHALNLGGELVVDADAQANASYRFTLPLSCPRPVTL